MDELWPRNQDQAQFMKALFQKNFHYLPEEDLYDNKKTMIENYQSITVKDWRQVAELFTRGLQNSLIFEVDEENFH